MAECEPLSWESQGGLFRPGQDFAAAGARPKGTGVRVLHYEPVEFSKRACSKLPCTTPRNLPPWCASCIATIPGCGSTTPT